MNWPWPTGPFRGNRREPPIWDKVIAAFHDRYHTLAERAEFMPLPLLPETEGRWISVGQALVDRADRSPLHPGVGFFARMGDAKRAEDSGGVATR